MPDRPAVSARAATLIALAIVLGAATPVLAWGQTGHRAVNALALAALRTDAAQNRPGARTAYQLLAAQSFLFVHEADLPDVAVQSDAALQPEHFLDIEDFGGPDFLRRLPAARPDDIPDSAGRLPWVIGRHTMQLRHAIRAGRRRDALRAAVILSHFVADAHTPLHATRDYNGRSAADRGIHSRWESDLVESMAGLDTINVSPERAWCQTNIIPAAALARAAELASARALENSWLQVDGIYHDDARARAAADWEDGVPADWEADSTEGIAYLQAMQQLQGEVVRSRLAESARFIADLFMAAAAGSRPLPAVRSAEFRLEKDETLVVDDTLTVALKLTRLSAAAPASGGCTIEVRVADGTTDRLLLASPPNTLPTQAGGMVSMLYNVPLTSLTGINRIEFRLMPADAITPEDNRVYIRSRDWR